MKNLMRKIGLVALLCTLAIPAFAEKPGHRRGKHKRDKHGMFMNTRLLERAADKIGLDDSTLEQIKDKIYRGQKESIEIEAELKSAKLDLSRELDSASPDRAKVMGLLDRVGDLKTRLKKQRVGLMLDVRSMLSPAQIKQLKTMRREWKAQNQRRRGNKRYRAGDRSFDQGSPQ
ncbi:MAG: periplasmic heavy metal sensor [Myxococcota bacterium]|nr:periplasmic heavy metal sensor [Myxococcota bacterium]